MNKEKKYLVTSALPYANGALHLGHLAGAYLPADIFVRYLRQTGRDVVFVCGSDEHGAAITMRAKKEGVSPQEIIDKYHALNKDTFQRLGISFDYYHRTSAPLHFETAQEFFLQLYRKGGEFEERTSEQYFDEEYQQFLADRYITGTCPRCGHTEAYGDQCEKCGSALSPTELIDPVSTLSGAKPVLRPTKHWYFKLDKHAGWLREWIEKGLLDGKQHHDPRLWKKHVVGQCLSWLDVEGGLQPRAITRDLDWGIPVPLDEAAGKVLYVWFDAPIGYISSTKQWAIDNGRDWEEYWKGDQVELVHFIGKDNIVFHCIVFPAMLKAHGDFALPVNVPANQFLNFEGQKFSKSKGWGIEQHEYLEAFRDFPNCEDALRYALIRIMPENRDSDFRWDDFVEYHDKELADNLGNFVNRVVVLTNKYFDGQVPAVDAFPAELAQVRDLIDQLCREIESYNFRAALQLLMDVSSFGNTYLQEVSPWQLWKEDPDHPEVRKCLYSCVQIVALLAALTEPFIPFTAAKIRKLVGWTDAADARLGDLLDRLANDQAPLAAGHRIGEPELLFAKINDRKDQSRLAIVESQKAKLQAILEAEKQSEHEPVKPTIQFDDFTKLDIRTGTILEAEKIPKAKKLLKLTVDLDFERRTIVSGIAEFFEPEGIVGKKVIVLANLAPRSLKGVESQGMILMAENEKGELAFVAPPDGWSDGFAVR